MARERFRVVAKDAHFNDELCRMPYPADSEDRLRELIGEKAPNLTIVRIDPIKMAMYRDRSARSALRRSDRTDEEPLKGSPVRLGRFFQPVRSTT